MTPEEAAIARIASQGISLRQWAIQNNFGVSHVYAVLKGTRKCYRGKSIAIAISLGLAVSRDFDTFIDKNEQLTISIAKKRFRDTGVTVNDWAIQNGFEPIHVYRVLNGKRNILRGRSLEIAIALGLIVDGQTSLKLETETVD